MKKKECIEFLKNSFVYNASLGSKELFHSNTWAWLMERDKKFIKVFFDIEENDVEEISREEKHIDLTIKTKNNETFIIENKLKSIPTYEQLNKYIPENSGTKGLLTGVIETLDLKSFDNWTFIDYETIAAKISDILPDSNLNDIEKKYVNEYCEVIKAISIALKEDNEEECLKFSDDLDCIRLSDISKKLLMAQFTNYLFKYKSFNKDGMLTNCYWNGFNNKCASLCVTYEYPRDENDKKKKTLQQYRNKNKLYIEVQGGQYRFMLMNSAGSNLDALYDKGIEYRWFDEEYEKNKKVFGIETSMSKKYNKYETNSYTVVYQHYNISGITFESLANKIDEDIHRAYVIMENEMKES